MSSVGLSSLLNYGSSSEDSDNNDCNNPKESQSSCYEEPVDSGEEENNVSEKNYTNVSKRPKLTLVESKDDCENNSESVSKSQFTTVLQPKDDFKKKSLPMPSEVLQMFSNSDGNEKPIDDPSLHQGRTRSFPHQRGNWASYLYLPCPIHCSAVETMITVVEFAKPNFQNDVTIHFVDDMHLSVSRTLSFRHHWIEPFVDNIKRSISDFKCMELAFDEFEAYENDDKSRTFLSMKVIPTNALMELVKLCDTCLADFQLDPYYENPSFHISCAWILGRKKSWADKTLIPLLNTKWKALSSEDVDLSWLVADCLEFKTGNKLYNFPFTK